MHAKFVFQIRPVTVEKGFQLECEGILPEPLRLNRLFEAVLAAGQIGQGLTAEVQIFDTTGAIVEEMELRAPATLIAA